MSAANSPSVRRSLITLVAAILPENRATGLQAAVSFRPQPQLDQEIEIGPLRAAFAEFWEAECGFPVPICELRSALDAPVPIATVLQFVRLKFASVEHELRAVLSELIRHFRERIRELSVLPQRMPFPDDKPETVICPPELTVGCTVRSPDDLITQGSRFPTIYADPPWQYENRASRGAAENHYPTMTLSEICAEPVRELADENAHLHLWTTNRFLRMRSKLSKPGSSLTSRPSSGLKTKSAWAITSVFPKNTCSSVYGAVSRFTTIGSRAGFRFRAPLTAVSPVSSVR